MHHLELITTSNKVIVNHMCISLTKKEYRILNLLHKNPNYVFSKFQLYERIWEDECLDWNNAVICQIYQLRRKIESDPAHPIFIKTVRGYGYKFISPELDQ